MRAASSLSLPLNYGFIIRPRSQNHRRRRGAARDGEALPQARDDGRGRESVRLRHARPAPEWGQGRDDGRKAGAAHRVGRRVGCLPVRLGARIRLHDASMVNEATVSVMLSSRVHNVEFPTLLPASYDDSCSNITPTHPQKVFTPLALRAPTCASDGRALLGRCPRVYMAVLSRSCRRSIYIGKRPASRAF